MNHWPTASPVAAPRRPDRNRSSRRRGLAVVELAVCLPVMVILVLGAVETAHLISVQQGLTAAAYEAIRIASSQGGTSAAAEAQARTVLASQQIDGATVTFSPPINDALDRGMDVHVTVTAPARQNSIALGCLFQRRTLRVTLTMARL